MGLPERKPNRLRNYDYSTPGAYFVTICTDGKKCILSEITVGATIGRPPEIILSEYGKITDEAIRNIERIYPAISVDKYVIMPNHIHLLLQIHTDECGRAMPAPTVSTVIQQMKGTVTKQAGCRIWQKLFHDHIIRNDGDYSMIWNYIDTNALKWREDCFYTEQ